MQPPTTNAIISREAKTTTTTTTTTTEPKTETESQIVAAARTALDGALTCLFSFGPALDMQYDDSTLTLTSVGTPDPFVTRAAGRFYMTFTTGNRIEIWSSRSLVDIESTASKHVIWTPPPGTDHSADLWAPELHALRGRWYVYYAAAHPAQGNKSHRMYVLGGPRADEDPCHGQWEFLGRITDVPPDQWAIDGTVFELDRHGGGAPDLYFAYSGWPIDSHGNPVDRDSDLEQQLFVVRLEDPTTAARGALPVMISRPDQPWEITRDAEGRDHGINEGPQLLRSPHDDDDGAGWFGLAYSCAGSWTHEYKMATLQLARGADPLDPGSWRKSRGPLAQTRKGGCGPYGPGHGSFLNFSREGGGSGETVAVYHATDSPTDGWQNRRARVQRVAFDEEGPFMGCKAFGERHRGGLVSRIKARVAGLAAGHGHGGGGRKAELSGTEGLRALLEGGKGAE